MLRGKENQNVELLPATDDKHEGVIVEMTEAMDPEAFTVLLRDSLTMWRRQDQVTGESIAKGPKVGRLFLLLLPISAIYPIPSIESFACNNIPNLSIVWHHRLGHLNTQVLSHIMNSGFLGNKERSSLPFECDSCKLDKSKTLPFPLHASRASHCFDLIHSDVWGPSPITSHDKFKYYVTFIDDHSRFTWVYFLRSKSEVFCTFTEFLAYIENQFSANIKTFRTDSGGEYLSTEFQVFLASKGIIHQRSCLPTPQQNGVAERKNRHLLDMGKKGVWIKLPIELVNLVQSVVKQEGFIYHHAEPHYLMLVYWIPDTTSTIPANASHRVCIGAIVLKDKREVLVVQEKNGPLRGMGVWKIPTGAVEEGEDIFKTAVREVKEETGRIVAFLLQIDTEFLEILAFRQSHRSFFCKSDLFFLCVLRPISFDIQKQELEIEAAQWMPVEEFAAQPFTQKYDFFKYISHICLEEVKGDLPGFSPIPIKCIFSDQLSHLYLNNQDLNLSLKS